MTDHAPLRRPTLAAAALLLALAACQDPADTPEPADAAAAQPAQAAAPAGTAAAGGPVVEERLATVDCETPSQGRVYFGLGDAVFAVPGDDVRTVIPPDVTPQTPAAEVVERLRQQTAQGAGCPESPLQAGLLGVAAPAGDPILADTLALFRSPPGAIATPYANLTREMLGSRERCRPAESGLLACPAVEQDGATQTQSVYFVATDASHTLSFGGPLAARCVVVEDRIRGCEIVDELPGGVALRVPLRAVPQTAEALAAAHRAAVAQAGALRV